MSPHDMQDTLSSPRAGDIEFAGAHPSSRDYAMLEEYSFIRREAQAEATEAYFDWADGGSAEGYAVYRAAQDRADAAQDDLANWTRVLAV